MFIRQSIKINLFMNNVCNKIKSLRSVLTWENALFSLRSVNTKSFDVNSLFLSQGYDHDSQTHDQENKERQNNGHKQSKNTKPQRCSFPGHATVQTLCRKLNIAQKGEQYNEQNALKPRITNHICDRSCRYAAYVPQGITDSNVSFNSEHD